MEKQAKVVANWEKWMEIEGKMAKWTRAKWFDHAAAQDVLAGGREVFVRRCKPGYPTPRLIAFAKLCCKHAARQQGFWGGSKAETCSIEAIGEVADERPSIEAQMIDDERLACLYKLVSPQLRRVIEAVLAGETFAEAAKAAGMDSAAVSEALAYAGRKLAGRARVLHRRPAAAGPQLDLFQAAA